MTYDTTLTAEATAHPRQVQRSEKASVLSRFFGFKVYLFLSLVLSAIIPLALLTFWVTRSALDREIEAVEEKHLIVAQNLSEALSRYVTDTKLVFNIYSSQPGFPGSQFGLRPALADLNLRYLAFVDEQGEVIGGLTSQPGFPFVLPSEAVLTDLRQRSLAAPGKTLISGIQSFSGSPHLFVFKMMDSGVLALAPLDPAYIVKIQKAIAFGIRGHAMVVDHNGRVMAHPNATWQATSKDASKLSVVQKMISGQTGVMKFYSPPMKADMISGYTYVPETGWGVMVPQPLSELVERVDEVRSAALMIAISILVLSTLLSWWLSGQLAKPILQFVRAARKVSEGDLSVRIHALPTSAPAEIRTFASTFNTMTDELAVKNAEISAALTRAEEGSRTKSQFMAMISHEIRTPMNGLLGILELLQDSRLTSEQRRYVTVAQKSGRTLIHIINDILDFSKLEAGKLKIESTPFDIRDITQEIDCLFKSIADQKSLTIDHQVDDTVPAQLIGCPQRIRQVLFNLVGNAVKFTASGRVTTKISYCQNDDLSGRLTVTVTDTGIGIPATLHDRLFEDFSQCDATYSRQYGGTGLGLSISKRLLELMAGEICFNSVEGKGSCFEFSLPLSPAGPTCHD